MSTHANNNSPKAGLFGQLSKCWKIVTKIAANTKEDVPESIRAARSGTPSLSEQNRKLKEDNARLEQIVRFDRLTGILNRDSILTIVEENIAKAIREPGFTFCLGFLDGAGFKETNDRYGHKKGDELLQTLARRLKTNIRPYDHVGRYGGDEFVMVIDYHDAQKVSEHANKWNNEWKKFDPNPANITPFDSGWLSISKTSLCKLLPNANIKDIPAKDLTTLVVAIADNEMYKAKAIRKKIPVDKKKEDEIDELKDILSQTYPKNLHSNSLNLVA